MLIRNATPNDLDILLELRLELLELMNEAAPQNAALLAENSRRYLAENLRQGHLVALLGFDENTPVSIGILELSHHPPTYRSLHGRSATIYSVYTRPAYRNQGFARKILLELIRQAKQAEVDCINLLSTSEGLSLYQSLGFTALEEQYMNLIIQ